MSEKILIYGKDTWPYTTAAREAYAKKGGKVEYINVVTDAKSLGTMLKHSDGKRKVPVIVEKGKVIIGFNGRAWGVWFSRLYAAGIFMSWFNWQIYIFEDGVTLWRNSS